MGKKNVNYFGLFVECMEYSCQAAELLLEVIKQYSPERLPEDLKRLHEIEHGGDIAKHRLLGQLMKEFLPPIEREDIVALANNIDDVTDGLEDVLIQMYMFHIKELKEEALRFAELLSACCHTLRSMFGEFQNFRKPERLSELVIEVNRLEEEGDALYMQAMYRLYEGDDCLEISKWAALFRKFEDCCDRCEHVADIVELVVQKNA